MNELQSMSDHAQKIMLHHNAAHVAANSAISHAKEAGRLLLEVKAALPHGEFTPWIEANLPVTARQAQRYMQAAQGRELVRRSKSDTVSYLTCNDQEEKSHVKELAELFAPEWVPMKGYSYSFANDSGAYWVAESDKYPGYFHVSRLYGSGEDDDGLYDGTRRPIIGVGVEHTLKSFDLDSPADADWELYKGRTSPRPVGEPVAWLEEMIQKKMVFDAPKG